MKNIEAGIESSPGIVRIRARAEVAQSRMKELKLEERPDFMLGGGGGIDGDVNPVVMLRMGVKLPLFKDTKQGIATESAMYEYYAAKAELEDARSQLRTQMAVLAAELKKTGAVIDEYSGSIIPNSRAVFDATLAEYVAGRSDFSTLIEDLNSLINAKAELAKAESERLSVSARLQRLTGSIDRENTGDGRQETVEKHETKTN
jgi:outer membrane protein TolC